MAKRYIMVDGLGLEIQYKTWVEDNAFITLWVSNVGEPLVGNTEDEHCKWTWSFDRAESFSEWEEPVYADKEFDTPEEAAQNAAEWYRIASKKRDEEIGLNEYA